MLTRPRRSVPQTRSDRIPERQVGSRRLASTTLTPCSAADVHQTSTTSHRESLQDNGLEGWARLSGGCVQHVQTAAGNRDQSLVYDRNILCKRQMHRERTI